MIIFIIDEVSMITITINLKEELVWPNPSSFCLFDC